MVRDEIHADSFRTDGRVCLCKISPEVIYAFLSLSHLVHDMMERPTVVHVERRFGQLLRFIFVLRQGEHIRVRQTEISHRPVPEVSRHFACYVATETIDTDRVHPPMHGFEHLITHVLVVVVQFGDVGPIVLYHQVTQAVAVMPSVILGPLAIRRRVVGYPVEDDLKALLVSRCQEMLEVLACTKLRVDSAIIDDRVVAAECTFAGDDADRLARHDPDDVDTVLTQGGQQCLRCSKSTFRGRLTGV